MPGALFDAVERKRFKQVALLLNKKANIHVRNERGQSLLITALHIEDDNQRGKMFNYLLKRGANCCGADDEGKGVLEWAAKLNRTEQVQAILDAALVDYDLSHKDTDGYTALHYATMAGNIEAVKMLANAFRRNNISVDVPDERGLTPLLHAQRLALYDIVSVLIDVGGSIGRSDFTYRLNMRHWEHKGQVERLKEVLRQKHREISRLKMVGKLPEVYRILDKQNAPGDGYSQTINTPRLSSEVGNYSSSVSSKIGSVDAQCGSGHGASGSFVAGFLTYSTPTLNKTFSNRLFRGVSHQSLASESSGGNDGGQSGTSVIRNLPRLLESLTYQHTLSYRSPAVPSTEHVDEKAKLPRTAAAHKQHYADYLAPPAVAYKMRGRAAAAVAADEQRSPLLTVNEQVEWQQPPVLSARSSELVPTDA